MQSRSAEVFSGTLFFTPEQGGAPVAVAEQVERVDAAPQRLIEDETATTAAISVSFDGLMHHRGQPLAWINGRPLRVQVLPPGLVSVDLEWKMSSLSCS